MYPNIARVTKVCSDEMANAKMQFRNITRGIYAKYHYKSCYYLY